MGLSGSKFKRGVGGGLVKGAPQTQLAVTSTPETCEHPRNREREVSG